MKSILGQIKIDTVKPKFFNQIELEYNFLIKVI